MKTNQKTKNNRGVLASWRGKFKLFFVILLFFPATYLSAAENLYVDFDTVIQDNFLGINAVYHGFTYMPESIEMGMNDELRALELQRVEESGIHIARTFYRPDWAMGEGPWVKPDWQSIKMEALYKWLADMKARNVEVALNMGWWFPRDVIWNSDQHLPAYPADMRNYAQWVSESLHQIVELRGFDNVKYIFMFTEPGNKAGDIPNGKENWKYYKDVLRAVHEKLVADGRRKLVKMVGPNTTQAPRWVARMVSELNDVVDIYASHNYNYDSYKDWYQLAVKVGQAVQATGKPFWIDEYGFQDFSLRRSPEYGNLLAQANAAFMNAGAQTSLLWILNDQYYPYPLKYLTNGDAFLDGKHSWGLFPWLAEGGAPRPAWFAFSLLGRLLGNHSQVVKTIGTEEVHVAAVKLPAEQMSILVVNGAGTEKEIEVRTSAKQKKTLYKYLYDPARFTAASQEVVVGNAKEFSIDSGRITDTIPPRGVAVYSSIFLENKAELGSVKAGRNEGNLAYLKKATATSSDPEWPVENITDGNRLRFWSSAVNRRVDGQESVTVDLGHNYYISQVEVYPASAGSQLVGPFFPVDFTIGFSLDNVNWTTVVQRQNQIMPKAAVQAFHFISNQARYIKFTATRLRKSESEYRLQIGEIKAYQ